MRKRILKVPLLWLLVMLGNGLGLLFSSQPVLAETLEGGANIETATLITNQSCQLKLHTEVTYFKFIAADNATYQISSNCSSDPYCNLLDSGNNILATGDDQNGTNFVIDFYLTAGQTCYLAIGDYSGDNECTLTISNGGVYESAPPTIATSSGTTYFTKSGSKVAIDNGLTVADNDSSTFSAYVQITGNYQSGADVLSFTNDGTMGGVSGSFDSSSGQLALSGSATVAQWQAALRAVNYYNSSATPSTSARTITFTFWDESSSSSAIKTMTINDPPTVAVNTGLTLNEGLPVLLLLRFCRFPMETHRQETSP